MFDGYIGLGIVILAMLAILILYFVFANKPSMTDEADENWNEEYGDYYDEYSEDDGYEEESQAGQKTTNLYRQAAVEDGWETSPTKPQEPAFAATFDPNAQREPENLEATTVIQPRAIDMGETVVEGVSEETILLPKEEIPAAAAAAAVAPVLGNNNEDVLLPEKPLPFGYKMAWLAIPHVKSSQVLSALQLGDITPANWTKGLTVAYDDKNALFVTPVLRDWVLVIGRALWSKADLNQPVQSNTWLRDMSQLFDEAYYFSTMRGLENHGWVKMQQGKLIRAYGVSGELGEVMWCYGQPTQEELAVNPNLPGAGQLAGNEVFPNEKTVLEIAANWTINTSFTDYDYPADLGFIGKIK